MGAINTILNIITCKMKKLLIIVFIFAILTGCLVINSSINHKQEPLIEIETEVNSKDTIKTTNKNK